MATKSELRDQVLFMLGKIQLGQAAESQYQTDIEQSIDEVYEDLAADKLTVWASTGDIPNDVLPHVKALVAFNRSDGISQERYSRILAKASIAKREIKRIIRNNYESVDNPTDY